MRQQHLFPNHLLIEVAGNHSLTTSLKVAEHFHKRHKNVIRDIKKLDCPDEFWRLNFEPRDCFDKRNKPQKMYTLTKDGFMFLAMGFKGKKAGQWKVDFIEEFNRMDAWVASRSTRFANALYQVRPYLKPIVEGTEQGLSRREIAQPLNKSNGSITYHRRKARELGLLQH